MRSSSIDIHRPSRTERLCWWLILLFTALFLTALQLTITAPYGLMTLNMLAHFKAVEPFQHRVLIPLIVAGLEHLFPLDNRITFALTEMVTWIALVLLAERALSDFNVTTNVALRRALALTLMVPLAIVTLVPDLHPWPAFAHSSGLWDLGNWKVRTLYYYPYDLPAAAFTLALLLAFNRLADRASAARVAGLVVVFIVATVNRETTLFAISMAALMFFRHPQRLRVYLLLAILLVIFLAIQFYVNWIFADQPNPHGQIGDTQYEWHWYENWLYMKQPFYAATELVRFLGGLWLPMILWWRFVDGRLRAAVLGFVPPLVVVGLIIGRVPEHRIFIEAVPLVWLAAVQGVVARVRLDATTS